MQLKLKKSQAYVSLVWIKTHLVSEEPLSRVAKNVPTTSDD
jgi:hypothetical protein